MQLNFGQPAISSISVAIEKKPNTIAESAENANARKFLYLSWRITETTDNNATSRIIVAKTILILMYPPSILLGV